MELVNNTLPAPPVKSTPDESTKAEGNEDTATSKQDKDNEILQGDNEDREQMDTS